MPQRATSAAWLALALVAAVVLASTLTYDLRDERLAGDQASFVLQTLSLAEEGNLSYGESDIALWRSLEWPGGDHPYGLHLQRNDHGWAFAKPYGYSVVAAPFVKVFGPVTGFAVASSVLLLAVVGVAAAILSLRFRGPVVPLVAGVYAFGSHTLFWAYPVSTELFLVATMGLAVLGLLWSLERQRLLGAVAGAALTGFLVTEKTTLLVALGPLLALAVLRLPGARQRAAVVGAAVLAFAIGIVPYLHYSDGESYNAYAGERYVLVGPAPFEPGVPSNPQPAGTAESFEVGFVLEEVAGVGTDELHATVTYLVGRHTGLLVFMPLALVIIGLALARGRAAGEVALAIGAGLAAYVGLYVVVFTENYFGGAQSIGNRYFLQVSPLVIGLAVAAKVRERWLAVGAAAALAVSLAVIPHHHRRPSDAFWRISETSPVQRVLPFDSTQKAADFFRGEG